MHDELMTVLWLVGGQSSGGQCHELLLVAVRRES